MIVRYYVAFDVRPQYNCEFAESVKIDRNFRPSHVSTNAEKDELALIEAIHLFAPRQNQIVGDPIDAWQWSRKHAKEVADEFYADVKKMMSSSGLTDFSNDAVEDFMDKRKLDAPDPRRFDMPTVTPGTEISIAGRLTGEAMRTGFKLFLSIIGWAEEPETYVST
jgi:hypothetical protein